MNNILGWFKSNWAIVVLGLIAVAALPALWFVSNNWNKKLVDQLQSTVNTDFKNVTASKYSPTVTGLTGESLLQKTNVDYNRELTAAYERIGQQLSEQSGLVGQTAVAFNRGTGDNEKKVLIEGIFPEPKAQEAALKPNQFLVAYAKKHADMLKAIHAGMPPAAVEIAEQLAQMLAQKQEQYRQEHGQAAMDAAASKAVAEELFNFRVGRYRARARELQVYADTNVFEGLSSSESADKPQSLAQRLANSWDLQERLWIHQDILHTIARANGDSGGNGIPGSVVKRILRVAAAPLVFNRNSDGSPGPAGFEAGTDKAPIDYARSLTGRYSGPLSNNKWYAVRNVTVEMIVDSKRLPRFIDALATVNFMTLVEVQITRVQPMDDLALGFYYGDEHVVKATLTIETIWFRDLWKNPNYVPPAEGADNKADSWRQWLVPKDLQASLAMLEGVTVEAAPAAPAPAARPPRPPPGQGPDDDLTPGRGRPKRGERGGDGG